MVPSQIPVIGDWYVTPTGESFEVVAFDDDEETVEIQYFDGAVEEIDLETWLDIGAEPGEPPEDWSGSMDLSREDLGVDDRVGASTLNNPLDDPEL